MKIFVSWSLTETPSYAPTREVLLHEIIKKEDFFWGNGRQDCVTVTPEGQITTGNRRACLFIIKSNIGKNEINRFRGHKSTLSAPELLCEVHLPGAKLTVTTKDGRGT